MVKKGAILAARLTLRHGRLCEAERQATAALQAARAFGLDTHTGAIDARLALAGAAAISRPSPQVRTGSMRSSSRISSSSCDAW